MDFENLMEFIFHRGRGSLPRNMEYHDTFSTLSRGTLLCPQTYVSLSYTFGKCLQTYSCSYFQNLRAGLNISQSLSFSVTPHSTQCNELRSLRPTFNCPPFYNIIVFIPQHVRGHYKLPPCWVPLWNQPNQTSEECKRKNIQLTYMSRSEIYG
jgi:hypothetical protein